MNYTDNNHVFIIIVFEIVLFSLYQMNFIDKNIARYERYKRKRCTTNCRLFADG